MTDSRIEHEIAHGKYLKEHGAGAIWNWETPAGKVRFQRRAKMFTSLIAEDMRVLEVGCGTGLFTKEIVTTQATVVAIDISPDLLEPAQAAVPENNVTFQIGNAYQLDFEDNSFDMIVGSAILHHLDMERALSEFYRVLKPQGSIFFTEPNMLNPYVFILKNVPFIKRMKGESPDETAFFRWQLNKDLSEKGFEDIRITPFDFLHPQTPESLITLVSRLGTALEHIVLIKEIAGSLSISAQKKP